MITSRHTVPDLATGKRHQRAVIDRWVCVCAHWTGEDALRVEAAATDGGGEDGGVGGVDVAVRAAVRAAVRHATWRRCGVWLPRRWCACARVHGHRNAERAYISSTFGWNMRLQNPIAGDLYGYPSGSST